MMRARILVRYPRGIRITMLQLSGLYPCDPEACAALGWPENSGAEGYLQ